MQGYEAGLFGFPATQFQHVCVFQGQKPVYDRAFIFNQTYIWF